MHKPPLTSHQKQSQFHSQIRRRQLQELFQVHRYSLPSHYAPSQLSARARHHLQCISALMSDQQVCLATHHEFNLAMKELREINCQHVVPEVFVSAPCLQVLVLLQKECRLGALGELYLHEILLNVSAHEHSDKGSEVVGGKESAPVLQVQDLNLKQNLSKSSTQLLKLTLQIMSNFLIRDPTSTTLYQLITKLSIFKFMLMLLNEKKALYRQMRRTYLWFANKVVTQTVGYGLEGVDGDWGNLVACVGAELEYLFDRHYTRDFITERVEDEHSHQEEQVSINEVMVYLRNWVPMGSPELTPQLLSRVQQYAHPDHPHALNLLSTVVYHSLHALPPPLLQSLARALLADPARPHAPLLLRLLTNSLLNDGSPWRQVLQVFMEGEGGPVGGFLRLLGEAALEQQAAQLLGLLVCGQGGLGVFEEGLEGLLASGWVRRKLGELGFEVDEGDDQE